MSITTQERTDIIELAVMMFDAVPGSTYLAILIAEYQANGRDMAGLATWIVHTPLYTSDYPDTQSVAAFTATLLTPLGLQGNAIAIDFIHDRIEAGFDKGVIAYQAMLALEGTVLPEFATARAILHNETAVGHYYSVTLGNPETAVADLHQVIDGVTSVASTVDEANAAVTPGDDLYEVNLTTGGDTYTVGAGNFRINGLGGDDHITVTTGRNTVATLDGDDTITTGAGDDTVLAGDGANAIDAGAGANAVTAGTGDDTITTGAGNDVISGGGGDDTIAAGGGADVVTGGGGDDAIAIGADSAVDRVVIGPTAVGNGNDEVTGFSSGIDKLDVDAMTPDSSAVVVSGDLTVENRILYLLVSNENGAADSVAASAAAIEAAAGWTDGEIGVVAFFIVSDNNSAAIYQYVEKGFAGIDVDELTLMGTVDERIVAGDLLFA